MSLIKDGRAIRKSKAADVKKTIKWQKASGVTIAQCAYRMKEALYGKVITMARKVPADKL